MQEGYQVDGATMALKRLEARAAAGVPDLDRAVVRRRREPGRVVREGHRRDGAAVALERLQARAAASAPVLDRTDVRRRRVPSPPVDEDARAAHETLGRER